MQIGYEVYIVKDDLGSVPSQGKLVESVSTGHWDQQHFSALRRRDKII